MNQQINKSLRQNSTGPNLCRLLCVLTAAVLTAGVLTPHIFNGIVRLGRLVSSLARLRNLEFEDVFSRTTLLCVVLGLVFARRWMGVVSWGDMGWGQAPSRMSMVLRGWLVGVVSLGVIYLAGVVLGSYAWSGMSMGSLARMAVILLVVGFTVSFIEETFFRGLLFRGLLRSIHWGWAAGVASLIFSAVHFIKPVPVEGFVHGHAGSAFRLMGSAFGSIGVWQHVIPISITLFLMSVLLCMMVRVQGHLYFVLGLHAGWIWMLQAGDTMLTRDFEFYANLFGPGSGILKSWAALLGMAVLVVVYFLKTRKLDLSNGSDESSVPET